MLTGTHEHESTRPRPQHRVPHALGVRSRARAARARRVARSAAFQELYFIYHRRLARFLTRFVHRYDIAEEVINDTMWVVWSKACDFRDASRVSTWIMGIAYRRALKTLQRVRAVTSNENPGASVPELTTEEPQRTERVA